MEYEISRYLNPDNFMLFALSLFTGFISLKITYGLLLRLISIWKEDAKSALEFNLNPESRNNIKIFCLYFPILIAMYIILQSRLDFNYSVFIIIVSSIICSISWIDFNTRLIPIELTYFILMLGYIKILLNIGPISSYDGMLGSLLGYSMLWSISKAYKILRSHEGIGDGDAIMTSALGPWLGVDIIIAILLASILAILSVCLYKITNTKLFNLVNNNKSNKLELAFGPYIGIASIILIISGHHFLYV